MNILKIAKLKGFRVVVLMCLPALFFYLSMFFKSEMGFYHLFGTDAEYAYLFNGLNLYFLNFPFHVQGPGTPLHIFSAIVISVVHLFRINEPIVQDVMNNPDLYLTALHATLTAITAILLYFLGYAIANTFKDIFVALFIQLIPFSSWQILDLMRRYMLENMIIAGVLVFLIVMFLFINTDITDKRILRKYLIWFSIVTGFIAATKLMYLPIAIIPFLVLPGYKNKSLFVLFSIIAFCILAFAIFHDWVTFRDWHLKNFLHSGFYGRGDTTIVDTSVFISNLKTIIHTDRFYKNLFLVMLAGIILYHVPFFRVKVKNDRKYYALVGIVICTGVMTALVSKQLKYYYLITALLLKVPGAYLLFEIYKRPLSKLNRILLGVPLVVFILLTFYRETMVIYNEHDNMVRRREYYMDALHYATTNFAKNEPTLVIPDYYGAPYKEYGLFFGISWSGSRMRARYAAVLNKLYPNIYFYHDWNNLFNQWDHSSSYAELLKKYKKIVLFVGDAELERSLYSKLHGINRQAHVKWKKLKSFPESKAMFYEVYYDTSKSTDSCIYHFNAEFVNRSENMYVNEKGLTAGNGTTQSSEYARSGKFSCKVTKNDPYGLTCYLSEVQKNEHYVISVWRYNNGNKKAGLTLSANNSGNIHSISNEAVEEKNNWQKLVIEFIVPDTSVNKDFKICVENADGESPAYFDDLTINSL